MAVVGKPNLYQTEDGNIIISLRAESIQRVDEATRNQWIMDTARRTHERLGVLKMQSLPLYPATSPPLTKYRLPSPAQDAERALEHYHTDTQHYRQMIIRALSSLKADLGQNGEQRRKAESLAKSRKPISRSTI